MTDDINLQGKSVEVLEAEARERIAAERKKAIPDDELKEGQPEINSLKKRSKNRALTLILLLFTMLIIFAWLGDKAYNHFSDKGPSKSDGEVKTPVSVPAATRTNLGQGSNPFAVTDPASNTGGTGGTGASQQAAATPPPVIFNKSLALASDASNMGNNSGGGQKIPQSRNDERSPAATKAPDNSQSKTGEPPSEVSVSRISLNPDYYIPIDTYIPCSLMRRFVSDVSGRISCLISDDVFSANRHSRLIPAGTIARGVYKAGTLKHGQSRMLVIWTELRTPDGIKIPMVDSELVGQTGEAGIDGWIDSHFWERFGNAMLLSSVQDVAAAAAGSAPSKDRNTDYTENSRAAAAEMAKTSLDNSINIPPTIYKNQGDIVGIMTGTDIDFSNVYQLVLKK